MTNLTRNRPEPPPAWDKVVGDLHPLIGLFAPVEYLGNWWVWLWRRSAGVRTLIEFVGAAVLVAGVYGLYYELEDRKVDRAVRVATLFAQIAQVHALPNGEGLTALKPSVEALAKEGVPISNIDLSEAQLFNLDLSGADLLDANLSGANLMGANLSGADLGWANLNMAELYKADLSGANLFGANLTGANLARANLSEANLGWANLSGAELLEANFTGVVLVKTDLSGADFRDVILNRAEFAGANLSGAKNLSQGQLALTKAGPPPKSLPEGLTWPFFKKDGKWVKKD